jgi:PAS domain S-box-containing protein
MRLAPKLTILFLLLTIGSTAMVGYLGYENGRRTIIRETENHLVSINVFKSHELQRWVEGNKSALEELAQRPLLRQYAEVVAKHDLPDLVYHQARESIIEDHLKPRLKYGGFFELFIMCPRHGYISASTDERQEGKYRDSFPYYLEGKSRTYVQGVYYSPDLEQPAMTISTPITDKQGSLVGVLAGRLDLKELSTIIVRQSGESPTKDTYLVNTFNFFVTEPRFGQGYALRKAVRTEGIEAGLAGKDGVGFYRDYRGVPVFGAYKWLPDFNMCIVTEIDQTEAFAPVARLGWMAALIAGAIAIGAGVLGLIFARTITRPVRLLVAGVEEIGAGNLACRVGTVSSDEIGELSRAFDRMAASLKATMVSRDELAKSEERFRIAASSVSDLIWDWDIPSGRLDWFGDIDGILGYEPSAFPRTIDAWAEAIHGDDAARVDATMERHLKEGAVYYEEYRIKRKDGTYRYWTDQGSALRDKTGEAYRMVGACSDITARKLAEDELLRLNEDLLRSNKELEQFAYVASHDLQEPLRMVSSFTQLLASRYQGRLDQDADDFIHYAVDGATRMQQLIQDLLTYSRITTRGNPFLSLDLHEALGEAVANLHTAIVESTAVVTNGELPTVNADRTQLVQVFQNLVGNALKFRKPGEPPRVHISAERVGHEWIISVQDNGIGIDPQYFKRLFVIFQRLHGKQEYPGTGIGLALCQRIVARHGGRIWVESAPGEGATFRFTMTRDEGRGTRDERRGTRVERCGMRGDG